MKEAVELACSVLIKHFEGFRANAYPDPGSGDKPWTIGYGSTHGVQKGDIWTEPQAYQAMIEEATGVALGLLKHSPNLTKEPPRRFAALISFAYNCGLGNYRISTLKRKVNQCDWTQASLEILKWNKAAGKVMRGLTRRREAESKLLA